MTSKPKAPSREELRRDAKAAAKKVAGMGVLGSPPPASGNPLGLRTGASPTGLRTRPKPPAGGDA